MNTLIHALNTTYQYVIRSSYSSYYRDLYASTTPSVISNFSDWRDLPCITREMIQSTPFWERIYVDRANVDTVQATSGTSGRLPLILPRSRHIEHRDIIKSELPRPKRHRLVSFQPQHLFAADDIYVLSIDHTDPEGTARLAAAAGITEIHTFSFFIPQLAPFLKKYNVAEKIQSLVLTGNRLIPSEILFIKNSFPNASLYVSYGNSECEGIAGFAKVEQDTQHIFEYSTVDDIYLELIDEQGSTIVDKDIPGEIVLTSLRTENNAFPLIRYRTGDQGVFICIDTLHPQKNTFDVLGRLELDIIKLPGGTLLIDEVARAVQDLHPAITDDFELHYYKEDTMSGTKPRVEIHLRAHESASIDADSLDRVAHTISKRLRIGPEMTYEQRVAQGSYLPLTCSVVRSFAHTSGKIKRFVQHNSGN